MKAPLIQWNEGKGGESCIMQEMGCYRISTKNGIDSLVAGG